MTEKRKIDCIIDSYIFEGYTYTITPDEVESLEEIVVMVISSLCENLRILNLGKLIFLLESKEFEIRGVTIDEIKSGKLDKIKIYEKIMK